MIPKPIYRSSTPYWLLIAATAPSEIGLFMNSEYDVLDADANLGSVVVIISQVQGELSLSGHDSSCSSISSVDCPCSACPFFNSLGR